MLRILNLHNTSPGIFAVDIFWSTMLSSDLDALLNLSKTTYPQKLYDYDCVTVYSNQKKRLTTEILRTG